MDKPLLCDPKCPKLGQRMTPMAPGYLLLIVRKSLILTHIPHPFSWVYDGFSRSALKHAWTGHREPLQSVSLGSFLTSSRPHPGVVPGEAASVCRRSAACPPRNSFLPSVCPSASVSQGTFGPCYGLH